MFKTFEEVLVFAGEDHDLTSFKVIMTDSPAVVERDWSDGTPASGYSAGYRLVSMGSKTEIEYSGGDMPSGRDRFRGDSKTGFMVLESHYNAGFTRGYPPCEYTYEVLLWGTEALARAAQIETVLQQVATLTVEHVYMTADKMPEKEQS